MKNKLMILISFTKLKKNPENYQKSQKKVKSQEKLNNTQAILIQTIPIQTINNSNTNLYPLTLVKPKNPTYNISNKKKEKA